MAVNVTPMGITTVPIIDGKPITKEQYDLLTDERKRELQGHTTELDSIIAQMAPQLRRLDRGAHLLVAELDKQVMKAITSPRLEELKRDFKDESPAVEFIDGLGADMIEHIDDFRAQEEPQQIAIPGLPPMQRDGVFNRYKVNVIVTHATDAKAPAVFEESPS